MKEEKLLQHKHKQELDIQGYYFDKEDNAFVVKPDVFSCILNIVESRRIPSFFNNLGSLMYGRFQF